MKLHLGCGLTLIKGFVNIDNSPTATLSRLPNFVLDGMRKVRLLNWNQHNFAKILRSWKHEFRRADSFHLPFPDGSAEFCYSSHMIGWYHSADQLRDFFREVYRVMAPGAGLRVTSSSCFQSHTPCTSVEASVLAKATA